MLSICFFFFWLQAAAHERISQCVVLVYNSRSNKQAVQSSNTRREHWGFLMHIRMHATINILRLVQFFSTSLLLTYSIPLDTTKFYCTWPSPVRLLLLLFYTPIFMHYSLPLLVVLVFIKWHFANPPFHHSENVRGTRFLLSPPIFMIDDDRMTGSTCLKPFVCVASLCAMQSH